MSDGTPPSDVDISMVLAELEDRKLGQEAALLRATASRGDAAATLHVAESLVGHVSIPVVSPSPERPRQDATVTRIASVREQRAERDAAISASEAITDARIDAIERDVRRHDKMWDYYLGVPEADSDTP